MRKGLRERSELFIRAAGIFLALTCILGAVSGCTEKPAKVVISTAPSQTEPSESESKTPEFEEGKPVSIGEAEEKSVPFGRLTENVGFLSLGLSEKDSPCYVLKGQYIYCLSHLCNQLPQPSNNMVDYDNYRCQTQAASHGDESRQFPV